VKVQYRHQVPLKRLENLAGTYFRELYSAKKRMKQLMFGGLSALLLAASTISPVLASAPTIAPAALDSMAFNFTAPFISSSGVLNENHVIRVMVIGMALEDVMVSIPPQMRKFSRIQVTDVSGKEVAAKVTANQRQVAIAFNRPVESGQLLQISIIGMETAQEEGEILLYGVTAKRVGLQGEIPVGTARIQVPGRG
jgi:hypothetical protein